MVGTKQLAMGRVGAIELFVPNVRRTLFHNWFSSATCRRHESNSQPRVIRLDMLSTGRTSLMSCPKTELPHSPITLACRAIDNMNYDMPPLNDPPQDHRRHILVVDDDPLFRSLMTNVLRHDFDVAVANDGADGFYRALDHVPDLAVLDIQMPGWDGIKTLKAFRAHPVLAKVKVVVLTSDSSRETVLAAINAGADDFVIKTAFSRDEFRSKLNVLLRQVSSNQGFEVEPQFGEQSGDDAEDEGKLVGAIATSSTAASWGGSEEVLQEAIDAWE